ncbi:MAG: SpaA isopeptide-forming pilin-related protein, partial [Ilumatobacteraceae bacterium]
TTASDDLEGTYGQCVISDVEWGSYWLVETTSPSGYYPASPVLVTITGANRDITTSPIVDPIQFKVVTFVCDNEGNLVASDVSYTGSEGTADGSTVTSVDADPATDATIVAGICGATDGYVLTQRGDVTSDITIP